MLRATRFPSDGSSVALMVFYFSLPLEEGRRRRENRRPAALRSVPPKRAGDAQTRPPLSRGEIAAIAALVKFAENPRDSCVSE